MEQSLLELDPYVRFAEGQEALDIGCGLGKWGHLLKIHGFKFVVGVDIAEEYLRESAKVYDEVVRCHASYLPFRSRSFDSVIAAEVIEHLAKPEGLRMIDETERVARRVIAVTTPAARSWSSNPEHRTIWGPSFFRRQNFVVCGVRRTPLFSIKNPLVRTVVQLVVLPVSFFVPELATSIVAVKKIAH